MFHSMATESWMMWLSSCRWSKAQTASLYFIADPTVSTSRTQQRRIRWQAASIWLYKWMHIGNTSIWRIAFASTVNWHRHSSKRLACHIRSQATTNPNPNVITYGVAISACEKSSQWQWALQLSPWHQLNSTAGLGFGQLQAKGWAVHDALATKTAWCFVWPKLKAASTKVISDPTSWGFLHCRKTSPQTYTSTTLRLLSQTGDSSRNPYQPKSVLMRFGSFCLFWCIAIWFEWTSLNSLNSPDILMPKWAHELRLAAFDRSSSWPMAIQLFSDMTSAKVQPDRHSVACMKVPEHSKCAEKYRCVRVWKSIERLDWTVTPRTLSEAIPTTASSAPVND